VVMASSRRPGPISRNVTATRRRPQAGAREQVTRIGLAVSARIAREHRGWIGVITQEGRGSTFTVYLPPIAPAVA
jgi:signal transduction histidine kinase